MTWASGGKKENGKPVWSGFSVAREVQTRARSELLDSLSLCGKTCRNGKPSSLPFESTILSGVNRRTKSEIQSEPRSNLR